jgi:hypothetical protein
MGDEAEPVEVVKQRHFVLRPAAIAIVIFDPQQHLAAARARLAPYRERVGDMAEVELPGRRRGEARQHQVRDDGIVVPSRGS